MQRREHPKVGVHGGAGVCGAVGIFGRAGVCGEVEICGGAAVCGEAGVSFGTGGALRIYLEEKGDAWEL